MINIVIIGYGYWGPNIVRNFNALSEVNVISICDIDYNVLKSAKLLYSIVIMVIKRLFTR